MKFHKGTSSGGAPAPARWETVSGASTVGQAAEVLKLKSESLAHAELDARILPNEIPFSNLPGQEVLFHPHSKELLILLRETGLRASFYEDGRKKKELLLRSADVYLPTLQFFGEAALAIGLNMLASWIYDTWVKDAPASTPPPRIKAEYLHIEDGERVVRWKKIEGSAKEVADLLKAEAKAAGTKRISRKKK